MTGAGIETNKAFMVTSETGDAELAVSNKLMARGGGWIGNEVRSLNNN